MNDTNTNTTRILYFEGAGSATEETKAVGNCLIRTAFHAKDGKRIYLEMDGWRCYQKGHPCNDGKCYGTVDFAHYITGEHEDCNINRIKEVERTGERWEYTLENILAIVRKCGGEFDAVRVLPDLAGYRVHRENYGGCNYADEFKFDQFATTKREEIHAEVYRLERESRRDENARRLWVNGPGREVWPNFSLWVPEDRPDVLRWIVHMNCRNYETEININAGSVRECIKAATGWNDETYGDFSDLFKSAK